jgi:ubiquitin thioesterase protein OTUB1
MMSLNNLLTTVGGFESWVWEDMVEETITLLRDLTAAIHDPQLAADILYQRWNNAEVSNSMVYHLRLLASSWLKGNPNNYSPFLPGNGGVDGYCSQTLEIPDQEIDHLGMTLLTDVLLKPIGFAVEIVYLDRSAGSQVNTHMLQAEDADGMPANPHSPLICLLYRPSHYDILYKDKRTSFSAQSPIAEAIHNPNLQVNRATNFSQQHHVQGTTMSSLHSFASADMSALLGLPGFSCTPVSTHHGFPTQYSPIDQTYAGSPVSASISPVSPGPSSTTSNLSLSGTFAPQPPVLTSPVLHTPQSSHSPLTPFPSTSLPIHTHNIQQSHPSRPSLSSHPSMQSYTSELTSPTSAGSSSSFRPSKYEWEAAADWQEPIIFQTSTFKNSHYNVAHYNNPNFQPLEWDPDCEEAISGIGRKKSG